TMKVLKIKKILAKYVPSFGSPIELEIEEKVIRNIQNSIHSILEKYLLRQWEKEGGIKIDHADKSV
ncbi:unnamed protein product, partial [marine sediment metagenome]